MNPFDYEVYDSETSAATVYACDGCQGLRFCTIVVKDYSTPMACPIGGCPEWRVRRRCRHS